VDIKMGLLFCDERNIDVTMVISGLKYRIIRYYEYSKEIGSGFPVVVAEEIIWEM
jgi:hypothetical protein